MTYISREYNFCAAHRIENHPKCGRLHGHNYRVTVGLKGFPLDDGMILDYGVLDRIVKPIIDKLDHRYIVSKDNMDNNCPYALKAALRGDMAQLPIKASTAECLAKHLSFVIAVALEAYEQVEAVAVEVSETPRSSAIYETATD